MTFWSSLKPAVRVPVPVKAELTADRLKLHLAWDGGQLAELPVRRRRQFCPCAECVDEGSGRRTLDQAAVPEGLKATELSGVGNYTLTFTFSDGHRTGIFPWKLLRELSAAR